ncbi:MAG: GTPase HflX [Chloroflexi bacterium]|nr:GTPase HflX [Chloroflexota bacterium]MCL5075587.1 GTPase HflX [Chloroflexota bacterium]
MELAEEQGQWSTTDSIEELRELAITAGAEVVGSTIQRLRAPNPTYYIGKGKVEELRILKNRLQYDFLIFDGELSPSQQRNLEETLGLKVIDHTGLILDIFAHRARTHEGRLQVELAQYQYLLPRLTGRWTHLSRQMGGIGARGGPGETQLEVDRRRVRERIRDLRREIEDVRKHRALYRQRRSQEGLPVVSLVGYTNAGKSTLLNALTDAGVFVEDRLFATLDPTTRRIRLPSGREVLLTDTVGFIQKLPPTVVAAFRATLEELHSADALIHIVDIMQSRALAQKETVKALLSELDLADKPSILVLNKIDKLLADNSSGKESISLARRLASPLASRLEMGERNVVLLSSLRGWGILELLARVEMLLMQASLKVTIMLPYDAQNLVSLFHQKGSVTEEEYTPKGTRLSGLLPSRLLPLFKPYIVR